MIGLLSGYFGMKYVVPRYRSQLNISESFLPKHHVIGFLPYWLVGKANKDYNKYITTLTYFGLTIGTDGKIVRYNAPGEEEPGWSTLRSGKVDAILKKAEKDHVDLSLLVFNADEASISALLSDPAVHARNLVEEVAPIMSHYGFKDLNIDIESASVASEESRIKFTSFIREVKKNVDKHKLGTITLEASPTVLIKKYLINLTEIHPLVDYVVLMTYDYHYQGSSVTGAVSPIGGAGTNAEFDTITGVREALRILPPSKILVGAPLYGYEWETLSETPRSAVLPGSGLTASNRRTEQFLNTCKCTIHWDEEAKESYIVYKDKETDTFHHLYYPDKQATQEKVNLVKKYNVGGLALWALGYDGKIILNPLENYKNSF